MEKLLIPENDLQELWELNGRVKAVLALVEKDGYDGFFRNDRLAAMLGAPAQMGAPAQAGGNPKLEEQGGTQPEPAPKEDGTETLNIKLTATEIGTPDIQTGGGSDGQN